MIVLIDIVFMHTINGVCEDLGQNRLEEDCSLDRSIEFSFLEP